MRTGYNMTLKTRLDGRSTDNNSFKLIKDGEVLATIACLNASCELDISTADNIHIEKPSGFSSLKNKGVTDATS